MNRLTDTFTGSGQDSEFSAKWIKADGTVVPVQPKDGKYFSLEEMQEMVGGYIEMIRPPSRTGALIICNEEGKMIGLPYNKLATAMWQAHAEEGSERMLDEVVGDILLCHESQLQRDEV